MLQGLRATCLLMLLISINLLSMHDPKLDRKLVKKEEKKYKDVLFSSPSSVPYFKQQSIALQNNNANQYSLIFNRQQPCITQYLLEGNPVAQLIQIDDEINFKSNDSKACNFSLQIPYRAGSLTINTQGRFIFEKKIDAYSAYLTCKDVDFCEDFSSNNGLIVEADSCKNQAQLTCSDLLFKGKEFEVIPKGSLSAHNSLTLMAQSLISNQGTIDCSKESFIQSSLFKNSGRFTSSNMSLNGNEVVNLGTLTIGDTLHCANKLFDHRGMLDVSGNCIMEKGDIFSSTASSVLNVQGDWKAFIDSLILNGSFSVKDVYVVGKSFTAEQPLHCIAENAHLKIEEDVNNAGVIKVFGTLDVDSKNTTLEQISSITADNLNLKTDELIHNEGSISVKQHLSVHAYYMGNAGKIKANSSDVKADYSYCNITCGSLNAKNNLIINTPIYFNLFGLVNAKNLTINSAIGLNAFGISAAKNMSLNSLFSLNAGLLLPKFDALSELYSLENVWRASESLFINYVPVLGKVYAALKSIKGTFHQGSALYDEIGSLRQQKKVGKSDVIALLCSIKSMINSARQTYQLGTQNYHLLSDAPQSNNTQNSASSSDVATKAKDVAQQAVSALGPQMSSDAVVDLNCGTLLGVNGSSRSICSINSGVSAFVNKQTIDTGYGANVGVLAASDLNIQATFFKLGARSAINGGNVTVDTLSFQGDAKNNISSINRTCIKTAHLDNQGAIKGTVILDFTGDSSQLTGIGSVDDLQYYGTLANGLADTLAEGKSEVVNVTQSGSVTLFAGDQNVHLEGEHIINHALKIESFGAIKCDKKLSSSEFVDLKAKENLEHKSINASGKVSLGGKNIIATPNVTRIGEGTNYEDHVEDITITGKGIEAHATEHVLYEAVKTNSGKDGTTMTAGGKNVHASLMAQKHTENQTVNQKTQETETVKDIFTTAQVCEHISEGRIIIFANDTVELHGTTINSKGGKSIINGQNGVNGYVVNNIHEHESEYKKEAGWFSSEQHNHIKSGSTVAKTIDFIGGHMPEVISDSHISLPFTSDSSHILLAAPLVENPIAKNKTLSYSKNDWSNVVWVSKKSHVQEDITYSPSFTGIIETNAEKIYFEGVEGYVLPTYKTTNNDTYFTRNILEEIYTHQKHSFQQPTRAASIVVAMAVTMATAGIGASAGATMVATIGCKSAISVAMVTNVTAAAVTSLSVQATDALLRCNGDFVAAAKIIASTNTLKNIVLSAGTSGVMVGAGQVLNKIGLPAVKDAHNLGERLLYTAPRQLTNATIKTVANVIVGQEFKEAVKYNMRSALAGTIGVACTGQIGDAYGKEQIDSVSHKLLHTGVGMVEGAIVGGPDGVLAGGMSAFITETVADVLAPEVPSLDYIEDLEAQMGRSLTKDEFIQVWDDQISNYWKGVSSTADISRFAAASITLLAHQDVEIANVVSSTAIDNNFFILAECGLIAAGVAYSAHEIKNAYKEGGSKAALKQLGVEVGTQAVCAGAVKVASKVGQVMYPTVKAGVTAVLESTPGLKFALGEVAEIVTLAAENIGQSAFGKGVSKVEAHIVNASSKIKQKFSNFGAHLAEDLVDHVVPRSVISKMEAQAGKQVVESGENTLVQTLGNVTKPDLVMTTPEGVKISVPDTGEAGLVQRADDIRESVNGGGKAGLTSNIKSPSSVQAANNVAQAKRARRIENRKITRETTPPSTRSDQANHIAKNNIGGALQDNYYEVNGFKFTQFYYDRLRNEGRKCPGVRAESVLRDVHTIVLDPQGYEGFFQYISDDWEMVFNPTTRVVAHLSPISKATQKFIYKLGSKIVDKVDKCVNPSFAEDLVDHVVPRSVISKMEAQVGKKAVEKVETTIAQNLGNLTKPDLVMTTPEGVKISVPDTGEVGLFQKSDNIGELVNKEVKSVASSIESHASSQVTKNAAKVKDAVKVESKAVVLPVESFEIELRQAVLKGERRPTSEDLKVLGFRGDILDRMVDTNIATGKIRLSTELQGGVEKAQEVFDLLKKEFTHRNLVREDVEIKDGIQRIFYRFEDGSDIQLRTLGNSGHPKIEITDVLKNIKEKITFK